MIITDEMLEQIKASIPTFIHAVVWVEPSVDCGWDFTLHSSEEEAQIDMSEALNSDPSYFSEENITIITLE